MIAMQNNFPQFQNNNQKLNQNQNINMNKNNFIPNITPVMKNMPEMIDPMDNQDMTTEILNISKIKEGFYIGDKISAISLDVIIQFKITHMINATGNQITNQWEAIGISYLTLNWSETPNQILFDPKDEIANRIVEFIDNSYNVGEGVLAHSFRGCDRVCIVVIIYLMKKYRWSLKKSIEYLRSKKQDIDIPMFFLEQLQKFENRMKMRKELTVDTPWEFEGLKDPEEKVMRNTYLNGFKPEIPKCAPKEKDKLRHITWADMNSYQKCPIEISNTENDLFFKKDIKPIFAHMQIKPKKGCIKGANNNIISNNNNKITSESILNKINFNNNSNNNNAMNKINNIINNSNNLNMMNNNEIRNIMNNNNINNNIIRNNMNRPYYENEKNEKISYNNFMQQKGNKRPEQQMNDFKNILNKNNFNYNNEKNNNFANLMRFSKQEPIVQNKEIEKKDKSPLRNWLNKERNDNENKFNFDFNENKDINDLQNKIKNNIRTNNSVNIQKSSQMNMESLNQGININKNSIKNNYINNSMNNNNIPSTTNYFKMNNNSNNNTNMNISFPINNSMNINHNIINNNIEVSKSQNQKPLNNFINDIRTNDFGNLANSVAPRQNKFINLPEPNQKNKNRNKNDYSPILRDNKKINKINNNIPNNNLNFEHNVNNSAGFMNLNPNKNNQMLDFNDFNINNREQKQNMINNNNMNQNKMMSNTMNNFNNNNNYAHFNNFNNEKKFRINDYSNNNLNNNNNFINYTPLIEDRHINNLINPKLNENQQHRMSNNNNIINEKIPRQNKNMYNNRPLNNFNPSLIKRKGTPQFGGHTSLLDRNQTSGPVKIKNGNKYNNNYIGNNNNINNHPQKKKPTTPDLNLNHRQKHDFIDINNNTNGNMNNHKYKYNGNNMNINSYNFNNRANNTMPNGFGYTGGPNNYKKTNTNSLGMTRPSTAPHKDKEKIMKNSNKANYQNNFGRMNLKHNQRPSSAGGKNKNIYGNNYNNMNNNRIGIGLGKNLSNANMNTKNRKKKLINEINKRLSTPQINSSNSNSNMIGFNNNINYGNNNNNLRPKINQAKNRMPSPMIKSNNNYRRPPLPNKNRIRTNKSDKFN